MKKPLFLTISAVVGLSALAIATSMPILINQNAINNIDVQSDYSLSTNEQNQQNSNQSLGIIYENLLVNRIEELNELTFPNFEININQLDEIKKLSEEDIYNDLVKSFYIEKNNNQFSYEIIEFKNNIINKIISFKIRVIKNQDKTQYLDTNLYTISWSLNTDNQNIKEVSLNELKAIYDDMNNNSIYNFETYDENWFKEQIYKELSKDRNLILMLKQTIDIFKEKDL